MNLKVFNRVIKKDKKKLNMVSKTAMVVVPVFSLSLLLSNVHPLDNVITDPVILTEGIIGLSLLSASELYEKDEHIKRSSK